MKFDVLSRHCDIHRHYLLEASAGTGKTYSIENVVVRLLIEPAPGSDQPLSLEKILVVTFTKAATRDLKKRIRNNLENARSMLSQNRSMPDYLKAIVEKGDAAVQQALKQIEQALFTFDQAQIFTIHGFCSRMLGDFSFEGDLSLQLKADEEGIAHSRALEAMRDFLRTELKKESWSPSQIAKLLSKEQHAGDQLCSKLLKASNRESVLKPFSEYVQLFAAVMAKLKSHFEGSKIIEDFKHQPMAYNKIDSLNLNEALAKIEHFASLIDKDNWDARDLEALIEDNFFVLSALDPSKRAIKKRNPLSTGIVHYANLHAILTEAFAPLTPCADKHLLFNQLAYQAHVHFSRFQNEEEVLSFDGLLSTMRRAVDHSAFAGQVRARYRVAIIDEFQDTDPLQWEIFSSLFLKGDHRLYLVGDPKQAIYAFRNADIYTYLEAAKALGEEHHAALETNYRSTKGVVKGLNQLFSKAEGWIKLPRTGSFLAYRPVAAGKSEEVGHQDALGSIHICFAEENEKADIFFPFIAQEILNSSIGFDGWAVLVKDKYQGKRLAQYLKSLAIPVVKQKQELLANSPALPAFREVVEAVLQPKDESLVKRALGCPLIGMTHDQLLTLQQQAGKWEMIVEDFLKLRKLLMEEGLPGFFPAFLESQSVAQRLLSREDGEELYDDLCQIVEKVFSRKRSEPLLHSLRALEDQDEENEEGLKRLQNPDRKGVHIMTLHASKGLEFEVVFPLGLVSETKAPDDPQDIPECDAEKMRQLYVAMTRAKSRLYLPALLSKKEPGSGKSSPMQLFLQALNIQNPSDLDALKSDEVTVARLPAGIVNSRIQEDPPCSLVFQGLPNKTYPAQMISSYTSLLHQEKEPFRFPAIKTLKKSPEEKSVHTLPAGSEIGNLLHTVLEKVALEELREAGSPLEVVPLIAPYISGEQFAEWSEIIAQIVFNAFHAPLPLHNGPIPLIATDPLKHFRETEFLFPWESSLSLDVDHMPGFLKGVIDLLFEHEGKYYLLDWKSNKLGERGEDYQRSRMEEAMKEGGYFLQAKVYIEALRRYLKLVDPGPFEEKFGGTLYLFLRGLDPQKDNFQGIYLCSD